MRDLTAWLAQIGLEKYASAFVAHEVDLAALRHLTDDDLKNIGLPLGARRKVLAALAASDVRQEGTTKPAPERRPVCVLFADLVGYTKLSQRLDAEDLHQALEGFFGCVDRIVQQHGGRVDKHIGDCVMAAFGAPVAHGNDVERAVAAALAIRDAVPDLGAAFGPLLAVHIGVASGQVVASGVGSSYHREYTVTGEAVNLAARLTNAAGAGEVLVSDRVWRDLAERLDGTDAGLLEVEGFHEPVRAWRAQRLRSAAARRALVGRNAELAQFHSILNTCRQTGRGRAVHLRGEAGIGKTRLLEEVLTIAARQGFACHSGLVLNFGSGTSRDAIQALVCGLLGLDSAADVGRLEEGATTAAEAELVDAENVVFLLDLLGLAPSGQLRVLYEAMDNAAREAGRAATLVQLVRRTNRRQPRVLAIEDLHWADAATLDLLAPLAAAVVDCPALLIMTSRIEQNPLDEAWRAKAGGGPLLTIDIGPLHADEAGELAASFPAVDAALARSCIERAAGNPLYLEQLLRYAVEGDASKVPGTVQSLVQARLDRLDADDRLALQAASVLGQRFDREALAAVLDQPSYDSERFAAHHMVQPHGTQFLFAHALIHEAVYDSLLKSRRAELHRRAADHYAAFDPGLRAAHLDRAGDPQAARAYLAAAQREATEYHYAAAQALGRRGLELANEREDRFALASLLGEVLHDLGDMPAALASCQEALTAAGSDAERCRAWLGLAAVKRVTDDIDGALADLIDAEAAAVTHGLTHELARLHLLRGNLYFPSGDIERCLKEHGRSLELAERTGSAELEAAALGGLGDGEYMRGRMMTARDRFARCVRLCQDHGLVRIEVANRPMLAFAGWFAGDGAKAAAEAALAIEMAQSVAHHRAEMIGRHAACFISLALMNLDAAFEHAEAALALARGLRARRFEAEGLALRADVRRARGDLPEAARDAEAAVALSFETGPAFVGPFALGVLARTVTDQRRRQEAMAEADRLLSEGAVSHNHLLFRRDAIEMAIDADDWDSAEKYAAALEAYTRDEPLPWAEFYVRRARWLSTIAREGSSPEALAQLRELRAEGERRGLLHALARI